MAVMSREEFGLEYEKNFRLVLSFVRRNAKNSLIDPEEITHDAWTRGWEKIADLKKKESLVPWIISIAMNSKKYMARRAWNRYRSPLDLADNIVTNHTEDHAIALIDSKKVLRLAPRDLIELHELLGFNASEIAEFKGMNENTVKVHLFRQRIKIKRGLLWTIYRS